MKRIAILLLAGATFIAAQTAADSSAQHRFRGDGDQKAPICTTAQFKMKMFSKDSIDQLQEKMRFAVERARDFADSARHAALEFRKQMHGKTPVDSLKMLNQHKEMIQERLQKAIDALDKASEKANAQIDQVRERIQSRLQQKKEELIKLQERIRAREQAKD